MQQISYSISVATSEGTYLDRVQPLSLEMGLAVNTYGVLIFTTPDGRYIGKDYRFTVYRSVNGAQPEPVLDSPFYLRKRVRSYQNGRWVYTLTCFSALNLLARRIVAYKSGSNQAAISGAADGLLQYVASYALSHADLMPDSRILAVDYDPVYSIAPTLSKGTAYRNVLAVLREIADASLQQGMGLYFDLLDDGAGGLKFRLFFGQRGVDRRYGYNSQPVVFSPENRNLTEVTFTEDFTEEVTAVLVAGKGEAILRATYSLEDTSRSKSSAVAYSEVFADARSSETAELPAEAQARLVEGLPKQSLTGIIVPTSNTQFMQHWGFGDYCSAWVDGNLYHCRINTLKLSYKQGKEEIEARIAL